MSESTDTEQRLIDLFVEEFDAVLIEPEVEEDDAQPAVPVDRWEGW